MDSAMMTTELTVLALAGILQVIQLMLMAIPANLELGTGKTLSPRDSEKLGGSLQSQVSTRTARLMRALNNHFEALLLFAIAAIVVSLSGQSSSVTALCAWAYLVARILYIPAYVFGWVPYRSIIWAIGLAATVLMLVMALIP